MEYDPFGYARSAYQSYIIQNNGQISRPRHNCCCHNCCCHNNCRCHCNCNSCNNNVIGHYYLPTGEILQVTSPYRSLRDMPNVPWY